LEESSFESRISSLEYFTAHFEDMHQILVNLIGGRTRVLDFNVPNESVKVLEIKQILEDLEGISAKEQRITLNCKELSNSASLLVSSFPDLPPLRLSLRVNGGKGGFGALLRGAGAKIGQKKNSNFDDCRDLNGRRIRNVRNEKILAEWYQQQKEHANKVPEPQLEPEPEYEFDETSYMQTIKKIETNIEDSVDHGIKQALKLKAETKKKEKQEKEFKPKRNALWKTEFDEEDEEDEGKEEESQKKKNNGENKLQEKNNSQSNKSSVPLSTSTTSPNETALSGEESQSPKEVDKSGIDLDKFSSPEELETLGLEILKLELQKRGLLCGGSLKERAGRLFSIKGKSLNSIDPKLLAKPNQPKRKIENTKDAQQNDKKKLKK